MDWHFEAREHFLTKFEEEPPDININEQHEVKVCCIQFSIISKMAFMYYLFTGVLIHLHITVIIQTDK